MTEQEKRIAHFESIYQNSCMLIEKLLPLLKRFEEQLDLQDELFDYYFEGDWRGDYQDDEEGKIASVLRRGVLSQDGIYDLSEQTRQALERMQKILQTARQNSEKNH